ncbi:MAG: FecR domain-containing protein [Pseudomonadota bacterium]
MTEREPDGLFLQAADILVRLLDNPNDPNLRKERDLWLARGKAEREAFEAVELAWGVTAPKTTRTWRAPLAGLAVAASLLIAYLSDLPAILPADYSTGLQHEAFNLSSGDVMHLDAGSAVDADIDETARQLTLLTGAIFVEVVPDGRPFTVAAGELSATALGTAYSVEILADGIEVAVAEGVVQVVADGVDQEITAGTLISISAEGKVTERKISADLVGAWKNDTLIVDNARLIDVASSLDRRIRGRVVIPSQSLADARVTGSFDLGRPNAALRIVGATQDARVLDLSPAITVIAPKVF